MVFVPCYGIRCRHRRLARHCLGSMLVLPIYQYSDQGLALCEGPLHNIPLLPQSPGWPTATIKRGRSSLLDELELIVCSGTFRPRQILILFSVQLLYPLSQCGVKRGNEFMNSDSHSTPIRQPSGITHLLISSDGITKAEESDTNPSGGSSGELG